MHIVLRKGFTWMLCIKLLATSCERRISSKLKAHVQDLIL